MTDQEKNQVKDNTEARTPPKASTRPDKSPEDAEKLRREKKAALAQVLDRGMVNARLKVKDGRPDRVYVYIRDRQEDIDRMKALHFVVETEGGKGLHGTGDNRRRIGDVVCMSTSRDNYEIIEEIKNERRRRRHQVADPKRQYLKQARHRNPDVPVLNPLGIHEEDS